MRSRSQCIYTENLCPGHNSSLPCWIWIIFHAIVVHDLDQRSYLRGQGHSAYIMEICVRTITPHCLVGSGYFTQLLSMDQRCVMTLAQGHISKIKVTGNTYPESVSGPKTHCHVGSGWKFHTVVVHDTRVWVCHDLNPRSYLQGQGYSEHIPKICIRVENSSLPCCIWIIFHTIVVHDQRSYLQGHGAYILKFRAWAITPHCHVRSW